MFKSIEEYTSFFGFDDITLLQLNLINAIIINNVIPKISSYKLGKDQIDKPIIFKPKNVSNLQHFNNCIYSIIINDLKIKCFQDFKTKIK